MKKIETTMGQKVFSAVFNNTDYFLSLPIVFRLKGEIDKKRLEEKIQKIINENDVFRIKLYKDTETKTVYQCFEKEVLFSLKEYKTSGDTYEQRYKEVKSETQKILKEARENCMNNSLQWDIVLFDMGENEHIFYARVNHLVYDGVSIFAFVNALVSEYNGIECEKSASFEQFIEEENGFLKSPEYEKLFEDCRELISDYQKAEKIISPDVKPKEKAINKDFLMIDCNSFSDFCKKEKLSLFHICLFMYHAVISAVYDKKESLILIPVGNRKAKYKNTQGYLFSVCINKMNMEDEMLIRDAITECRNRFMKNFKAAPIAYDIFAKYGLPADFILTYQNYIDDFEKNIPFGNAMLEPITDNEMTEEGVELCSLLLSVMESKKRMFLSMRADEAIFPAEKKEELKKAFMLLSNSLLKEGMTLGDYKKEFKKINTDI